jgi:hypothetical protein
VKTCICFLRLFDDVFTIDAMDIQCPMAVLNNN